MKSSCGAAVLLVLVMIALASAVVMHRWFVASLHYDIAMQRARMHKNFYTTEAVLHVGLGVIKQQFAAVTKFLSQTSKPYVVDMTAVVASIAPHDLHLKQAIVMVYKNPNPKLKDSVIVGAVVKDAQGATCQLCCKAERVVVKNEVQLAISHFTFGHFI